MIRKRGMSYEKKKGLFGFIFISPWLIGFIFLFMLPLLQSFKYSFSTIEFINGKPVPHITGFAEYIQIFFTDANASKLLFDSLKGILIQTIYLVILSIFIAIILNQKFHGRIIMRALFFLPVIVTSGIVITIINGDAMAAMIFSGEKSSTMLKSVELTTILMRSGFPAGITGFLTGLVDSTFNLTWKSGVQILLLLAGLQTIPKPLYEAASIDGATPWESFWLITVPMITPILLLTTIYSIIDGVSDYANMYQRKVTEYALALNYEYSAALSWVYTIALLLIVGALILLSKKRVYYLSD